MLRFLYWLAPRQYGKGKELHYMIAMFVAETNGCGFCLDFGRMMAVKEKMDMAKFNDLQAYRTSPLFSDKERAALSYAEEVTRNKRVSDSTFDAARRFRTLRICSTCPSE